MVEISRKVVLTVYDFLKTRLVTDGWDEVTVVDYNKGWPDDKQIILPSDVSGKTQAELDRCVVIPAIALVKQDNTPYRPIQIGGGITEDVIFFLLEYYALSDGQRISLEGYLQRILADVVLQLLDWEEYPQTSPDVLSDMEVLNPRAMPILDENTENQALRIGGHISFGVAYQRTEQIISNA